MISRRRRTWKLCAREIQDVERPGKYTRLTTQSWPGETKRDGICDLGKGAENKGRKKGTTLEIPQKTIGIIDWRSIFWLVSTTRIRICVMDSESNRIDSDRKSFNHSLEIHCFLFYRKLNYFESESIPPKPVICAQKFSRLPCSCFLQITTFARTFLIPFRNARVRN